MLHKHGRSSSLILASIRHKTELFSGMRVLKVEYVNEINKLPKMKPDDMNLVPLLLHPSKGQD